MQRLRKPVPTLRSTHVDTLSHALDPDIGQEVLADRDRFRGPNVGAQENGDRDWYRVRRALGATAVVLDPEFVGGRLADYAEIAGDTLEETLTAWPESGRVDLFEELSTDDARHHTVAVQQDTDRERGETVHEALAALNDEFDASVFDLLITVQFDRFSAEFEKPNSTRRR